MDRKLVFRVHALRRMFERNITIEDIELVLSSAEAAESEEPTTLAELLRHKGRAEVIENYPNDKPYPSRLLLGWPEGASSPRCCG